MWARDELERRRQIQEREGLSPWTRPTMTMMTMILMTRGWSPSRGQSSLLWGRRLSPLLGWGIGARVRDVEVSAEEHMLTEGVLNPSAIAGGAASRQIAL
jgi:hypothetical protein